MTPPPMSEQRPKRDTMSIEEATVSNIGQDEKGSGVFVRCD